MRAVTWHGTKDVRVDTVPDPVIQQPTDAIVRITTTNICGSDLHLYEPLGPFMHKGDVLGHEPMGIVVETGSETGDLEVGDRVVIPFQIACGHCWMCTRGLPTQCETTQVRERGTGAALFGYSRLYGAVPGGQAEYLRVPQAQFTHIKLPEGPPTTGSPTSRTSCPPPGRVWSTPACPTAGPSSSSGWARSVTSPAGSVSTRATG